MKSGPLFIVPLAAFFAITAQATVLFDSGAITFGATGTQYGRISRNGEQSTWGSAKTFPGVTGAPVTRGYEVFTVNSGIFPFLQISLDDPSASLFVAAYLNSFNPVNAPPNYGLDINYLGDPGLSQPVGNPSSFQIQVSPYSNIVLAINEVNPGGGAGQPFDLVVEGFLDAAYSDVPEPASFVLFGGGLAAIVLLRRRKSLRKPFAALIAVGATALTAVHAQTISPAVLAQMQALMREKQARNAVQQKLSSPLLFAASRARGVIPAGIDTLGIPANSLHIDSRGVLVDIRTLPAAVGQIANVIRQNSGQVIYAGQTGAIRARVPLSLLEAFASRGDIRSIKAGMMPKTTGTSARLAHIRQGPPDLLRRLGLSLFIGLTTSQGVITHGAAAAANTYGANGAGVRVGVLSDSAEFIPNLIASGDLPPDALNVADIVGAPGSSEGSAMMEIVYDMAPGVRLFFASAFNSPDDFADNIRLLRNTYNCDVIVDDVGWSDEGVFQDTVIANAVNNVTQSGAVYVSSAGNAGNLTNGTSSTWEGDFSFGGVAGPWELHSFGVAAFNRLLTTTGVVDLQWSDRWGASSNDYDLLILNPSGTAILAASTATQNGTGDPFEEVFSSTGFPAGSLVVVARVAGAQTRALHVELFFGEPLQIATNGQTHGHNASGGCAVANPTCTGRAFGVAAVGWNSARGATRPFVGGAANPTELFSSDGPRKLFYYPDGTPITPGNYLFGTGGGKTLVKPDIAAADGVSTKTPGFAPFFGTSAAAPHAAAIAAQLKSARPSATGAQIWSAMTSTALDIRAPGIDRDSGYGIVMSPAGVAALRK